MAFESVPKIAEVGTSLRNSDDAILIREIAPADADAAAQLSAELGYPTEVEAMRKRIERVSSSRDRAVYVACISDTVIGWIDVGIVHHFATGDYGEIAGFIVSSEYRSGGIGRKLLTKAEQWAVDQGMTKMVVRSRTVREAAHRFYVREGYSLIKTSAVFSKQLTG
jgi:GNAT superfamily N-acetyltransferase